MNENIFADLHLHTVFSDGSEMPEALTDKASSKGLKIISFTDHDTLDAYHKTDIKYLSNKFNINIIPGIEMSADFQRSNGTSEELHILAYYIDTNAKDLNIYLEEYRKMRYERAKEILSKLSNMNISITIDDLNKEVKKNIYGRLHVANVLVEKGYANSIYAAFEHFIGKDCPAYVPKKQLNIIELINLIHNSGGIAVIAHPGNKRNKEEFQILKDRGLDGIEVFHPDHSSKTVKDLLKQAKDLSLLVTGGSDYHGHSKKKVFLGDVKLHLSYFLLLKEAASAYIH
ncbi:MAG: PHP domain-containing protein [Candidatus Aureabacteria bacterium]|nr:PHP domain-containing protein [Candidatus Auribacterota bacterium]